MNSETDEERAVNRIQAYGFGRIYKRGGAWWVAWYDRGDRRESVARVLGKPVGAVTRRDAERLLKARLEAKHCGRTVLPKFERATVDEMLDDYERHLKITRPETWDGMMSQVKAVRGWLGSQRVKRLDLPTLEAAVIEREAHGWGRGTIKNRVALIHAAMVQWQRAGRLAVIPPMPKIREPQPRQGWFLRSEVVALTRHMPEAAADITWALFFTGWRISEILGLTWDRVDLREWTIRLDTSKNGEGRTRPVVEPDLVTLLERRHRERVVGQPWVFWRVLANGRQGARVSDAWFREHWHIAATAADLVGKIPHDFRRTRYRELVMSGVDLATAMHLTGHRSLSMALRYNIQDLARQRSALARQEAHQAALDTGQKPDKREEFRGK